MAVAAAVSEETALPLEALREDSEARVSENALQVVEQARTLLADTYVHLPGAGGSTILQRLDELGRNPSETRGAFERRLLEAFAELGDRHTHCRLPMPTAARIAFLPFRASELRSPGGSRKWVVVATATDALQRGDWLLRWNGASMSSLLERHDAHQLGAHPEARRAKAMQTLTLRPLAILPPPEESRASLEVLGADGRQRRVDLEWRIADPGWLDRRLAPALGLGAESSTGLLDHRQVETRSGTIGWIRIRSFQERPESFLQELSRTLAEQPPDGVVLDLRGCEEGIVATGEQLLQLFTSRRIEPQTFQFRLSDRIRQMLRARSAMALWSDAAERAAGRGETYSEPLPLTDPDLANGLGRRYSGPVAVLVDALTYSTAEMLAAGFQDHGIGPVVGVAKRTGGGGASPWPQSVIATLAGTPELRPLAGEPSFQIAVRRSRRTGPREGQLIEGSGVVPDQVLWPSLGDLLGDERDLAQDVGRILAQGRGQR